MAKKRPKQLRITESDYVKAVRKANREAEIEAHGKQISLCGGIKHMSKKTYSRKKFVLPEE